MGDEQPGKRTPPRRLPAAARLRGAAREFALTLPGAHEDFPWGERVVKVDRKVFVFLGGDDAERPGLSVKLPDSGDLALGLPGASPTGYGLGKAGWVSIPLGSEVSADVLVDWVEESYRAVAPKRLVRELDQRAGG